VALKGLLLYVSLRENHYSVTVASATAARGASWKEGLSLFYVGLDILLHDIFEGPKSMYLFFKINKN